MIVAKTAVDVMVLSRAAREGHLLKRDRTRPLMPVLSEVSTAAVTQTGQQESGQPETHQHDRA